MDLGTATFNIGNSDQGSVARITLSHPGKLNAMSRRMMAALHAVLDKLRHRDDLRAVVVEGDGDKAFIGGAYVPDLYALNAETCRSYIRDLHHTTQALRLFPVPVIAAIRGYCIGAGMELATGCDFRLADRSAVLAMPEVNVGMPSVIDAEALPRLIGWGRAREMMLTGGRYDAQEGYDMGFFQTICETGVLETSVQDKLAQILNAAPMAVRTQKALLNTWEDLHHASGLEPGINMLSEAYAAGEPHDRLGRFLTKDRS